MPSNLFNLFDRVPSFHDFMSLNIIKQHVIIWNHCLTQNSHHQVMPTTKLPWVEAPSEIFSKVSSHSGSTRMLPTCLAVWNMWRDWRQMCDVRCQCPWTWALLSSGCTRKIFSYRLGQAHKNKYWPDLPAPKLLMHGFEHVWRNFWKFWSLHVCNTIKVVTAWGRDNSSRLDDEPNMARSIIMRYYGCMLLLGIM